MLDMIELQTRAQNMMEEYPGKRPRPVCFDSSRGEPMRWAGRGAAWRWLLPWVSAALLVAVAVRPGATPIEASAAAAIVSHQPTLATTSASECWVTGDLVGDANPAAIFAARCGK
jgi:hypothetical protein